MTATGLQAETVSAPASSRLPSALMDPGAFPHRPEFVELRETHISWVFLAGDRAYKVKKPVVLPFLDYGTAARRRACCAEEVRVNRRLAPSVYHGLVALVPHGPTGLAVAPEHDPRAVEFAVEMRRYDEDATLAAHLTNGGANERDLAAVGTAIARFHAELAPATGGGATDRLGGVIEETLTTVTRAASGAIAPARVAALARFARSALAGLGPQLRTREAAGLVRDGHGDLRAGHVLLGRPMEFVDAIDFDPSLRVTDVAYDLAFLLMDVARRDERLARALIRGYAAAGGRPGDQRLLSFFVVIRALVRAKIDLLRASELDGIRRDEHLRRALELVEVAERFAWRVRLPQITCVAGLAASGKSTLAGALGAAASLPVLSSDIVRKAKAGLDPAEHAVTAQYARHVSRDVYATLGRAAAVAVREDGGAIVDATFRHPDDVAAFQAEPGAAQAEWIVCDAPPDVLLDRARWRAAMGHTTSDADPAVVATQIAHSGGRLALPRAPLARLETVRAVSRLLDELAAMLDARLALGRGRDDQAP
jgi:aminoglycoside phosphotransferase family enzyme/predicted kinase